MFSKISGNQFSQGHPSHTEPSQDSSFWYLISTVHTLLRRLFESLTLKNGVVASSNGFPLFAADDARLRRARMIAEARYGFRWHLAIYIIVNLGLVAIWYYTGAGFPWPIFPILFWGLGVLGHYWGAYHTTGGGWIERETQKILQEEDKAA
jgi:hypothetical protein